MKKFYNLKLKTQLLLVASLMVISFIIAMVMADRALSKVLVNGAVYGDIQAHKDLAADILPPPAYLVETWQVALEMAAIKNAPIAPLVEQSNQLTEAFKQRMQYWIDAQPQFHTILTQSLLPSGEKFIQLLDGEFIPAIRSADTKRIDVALANLKKAYQQHRTVIDELVILNDIAYKNIENAAPTKVSSARTNSVLLMLLAVSAGLIGLFIVANQIIKQLGGEASEASFAAQHIANGNFSAITQRIQDSHLDVTGALSLASKTLIEIDREMSRMEIEHDQGNLDASIDVTKFKGAYREMATAINRMVAKHIEVMAKTIRCLNGLAKGDFESSLEQFPGKLALVNNGVEGLRHNIKSLITDMRLMAEEHTKGNISSFMQIENFEGDYKLLAAGVNQMVSEYIDENKTVMACVTEFGNGDFSATVKEYPGEKAFISKSIKKIGGNLKALIDSVNWVSAEHEKGGIDMTLRDDMFKGDFSTLAKCVNKMIAGLLDMNQKSMNVIKAFGDGDFDAPLEQFPGKKAFINETVEQVRKNLKALNEDAQMLAKAAREGKISTRADANRHNGDYQKIVAGMNQTLEMIIEPIAAVKEAVDTIITAANEISSGNNDLSSRTEQQASSLEETAASMEELSATVKQNAENAKQANQLALTASSVAVKGGEVVGQVVSTMSAINESASKIENIISVIDGIAFQTNILALNAAVEAARAGEQGRGFAVVAAEVRNLAQRSASAAKEIKELIADSVSKTTVGTKLVQNAGDTMQEVVASVQRVADIISEITAASSEQSAGINQVNNAITTMDEATQQNAALVEEAAAAAESLVEQANQLSTVVSVFKIDTSENVVNRRQKHSQMRA